mmetsp:Transcript_25000/g.73125  ORF Transcript_25000/g.73125 Transcript_25000/m.73125 type:complete len:215 (-) Transcript_25000:5046-5690(-)
MLVAVLSGCQWSFRARCIVAQGLLSAPRLRPFLSPSTIFLFATETPRPPSCLRVREPKPLPHGFSPEARQRPPPSGKPPPLTSRLRRPARSAPARAPHIDLWHRPGASECPRATALRPADTPRACTPSVPRNALGSCASGQSPPPWPGGPRLWTPRGLRPPVAARRSIQFSEKFPSQVAQRPWPSRAAQRASRPAPCSGQCNRPRPDPSLPTPI